MAVKDILLDSDNELQFAGGDLLVSESDNMHIEHIMLATPGTFSQHPTIGVGLIRQLKGPLLIQQLNQDIRLNLRADNMKASYLEIDRKNRAINVQGDRIR